MEYCLHKAVDNFIIALYGTLLFYAEFKTSGTGTFYKEFHQAIVNSSEHAMSRQ